MGSIYRFLFLILSILIGTGCFAQTKVSRADSLKRYYIYKANKYLMKHQELWNQVHIGLSGIEIYAKSANSHEESPECLVYWDELEAFKKIFAIYPPQKALEIYKAKGYERLDTTYQKLVKPNTIPFIRDEFKPLKGLKIAVDPGHMAGNLTMAMIEDKFINMKLPHRQVQFWEGELTLATAYVLKNLLEQSGAEVTMTREKCNYSAFGKPYEDWLKQDKAKAIDESVAKGELEPTIATWLKTKATDKQVFHSYFKKIDYLKRAEIINAFKPDLSVVIHYNVDEDNKHWKKPIYENYNMAFVGGSFAKKELDKPEERFQFLRLLLTEDIENSISLSEVFLQNAEKILNVPTIPYEKEPNYLTDYSIRTSVKGVYARNLNLTRYIHGPVCYGETLYMDNLRECQILSTRDHKTECGDISSRVKDVAQAYYQGILQYFSSDLKKGL